MAKDRPRKKQVARGRELKREGASTPGLIGDILRAIGEDQITGKQGKAQSGPPKKKGVKK